MTLDCTSAYKIRIIRQNSIVLIRWIIPYIKLRNYGFFHIKFQDDVYIFFFKKDIQLYVPENCFSILLNNTDPD